MRVTIRKDLPYQRVLLKLSGEALAGSEGFGIAPTVLHHLCREIGQLCDAGVSVAVVLGGGNIFRGQALAEDGMDRVTGDAMGMLATVMNGLALADVFRRQNVPVAVFSSAGIEGVVARYHRNEAAEALSDGHVVILTGGTGNPLFTTDTAACLRGIELSCDAVLKATNVDGVYDSDPRTNPDAKRFDEVTYEEILRRELKVMDLTAVVLAKEHDLPLTVFDLSQPGGMLAAVTDGSVGTRVVS